MVQSDDGNFLIAGRTFSWEQSHGSPYVLKSDTAGNALWHLLYTPNAYSTWLTDICRTKESQETYVTVGSITPVHNGNPYGDGLFYINKIDGNGEAIWEKQFGIGFVVDNLRAVANSGSND